MKNTMNSTYGVIALIGFVASVLFSDLWAAGSFRAAAPLGLASLVCGVVFIAAMAKLINAMEQRVQEKSSQEQLHSQEHTSFTSSVGAA